MRVLVGNKQRGSHNSGLVPICPSVIRSFSLLAAGRSSLFTAVAAKMRVVGSQSRALTPLRPHPGLLFGLEAFRRSIVTLMVQEGVALGSDRYQEDSAF